MGNNFIRTLSFGRSSMWSLFNSFRMFLLFLYRSVVFQVQPFFIELTYFLAVALIGSLAMTFVCKPKSPTFTPRYIDMFFMSMSAVSLSGLNVFEMELFSESQIIIITLMMFTCGEVFVSLLSLLFRRATNRLAVPAATTSGDNLAIYRKGVNNMVEMGAAATGSDGIVIVCNKTSSSAENVHKDIIIQNSIKHLGDIVLCYISVFHVLGSLLVFIYLSAEPSAEQVLRSKDLRSVTFSIFTVVSSFSNNGLNPMNESLARFKANPGLLLMLVPLILCGNVQYPACLRLVLWMIERFGSKNKQDELDLMLNNPSALEHGHLFPNLRSLLFQSLTAMGLLATSVILFGCMDWNAGVLSGLTSYQKLVGVIFQSVSVRHAGEAIFDTSAISPAVHVFFVLIMYLPVYTVFMPINGRFQKAATTGVNQVHDGSKRKKMLVKKTMNISQSSYLFIFAIIVCITERKSMETDPLNFNIFNIVFEIVSAYGNVGLSMGYSCGKLITHDAACVEANYNFSGRWSDGGKLVLIFVMLFGRLKKYHMGGAKAWRLT